VEGGKMEVGKLRRWEVGKKIEVEKVGRWEKDGR